MKWRLTALSLSLLHFLSLAEDVRPCSLEWDFEGGPEAYRLSPWGTGKSTSPEDVKTIVNVASGVSHSGAKSLLLQDRLGDLNPYACVNPAIPVRAGDGVSYSFSGWVKAAKQGQPACEARICAEGNGKFLGWIATKKITLTGEWQKFTVTADKIPAQTTHMRPAISLYVDQVGDEATGALYIDDLRFHENTAFYEKLDVSNLMNRGFKDEVADDGAGGWTDQGDNDLRGIVPGDVNVKGVPFTVVAPSANNGRSVIALKRDSSPFFAEEAIMPVRKKCDRIYLLHTGAWVKSGGAVGALVFKYADGTSSEVKITGGEEVGDWWGGVARKAAAHPLHKANPSKGTVHLFACSVANPSPDKALDSAVFKSGADPKCIWLVLAATLGQGRDALEIAAISQRDYSQWVPFRLANTPAERPLVNLSFLLDAPAGKHGFLKTKDGHFVFEDGTPVRFLGTNIHSHLGLYPEKDQAERAAETLARYGVNIIRFHLTEGVTIDRSRPDRQHLVSEEKLDKFDYFVKCLKDKGVYMLIDSVTGLSARDIEDGDGVPGGKAYNPHRPWAYYSPQLIKMGRDYMSQFLVRKNRYTGKSLLEEPAVAMLMLINEQSLFFDWHESKGTPDYYKSLLQQMYNKWLLERFGTREALSKVWLNAAGDCALAENEDPGKGTVKLTSLEGFYSENGKWPGPLAQPRIKATIAFMKDVQTDYFKQMKEHLVSLGCKVPVSGTNIIYDSAELETHLALDYTSQNVYYDHASYNKDNSIFMKNHPFVDVNPVDGSEKLLEVPISAVKLQGRPVTSTETDIMWPHDWRSGYFLTMASTAALQDWDAVFQYGYIGGWDYTWDKADKETRILNPTVEFNDPAVMGMLPAASLMFQRHDISPAKRLVQVCYGEDDRFTAKGMLNRQSFPFSYLSYVSRVESVFGPPSGADFSVGTNEASSFKFTRKDSQGRAEELAERLDEALKKAGLMSGSRGLAKGRLTSDTGEIIRDWERSLLIVDTPRTQGFTGFPAAPVKTGDLEIAPQADFCTIVLSSLDGEPIGQSRRMLLSAVGRVENDTDTVSYIELAKGNSGISYGQGKTLKKGSGGAARFQPVKATIKLRAGAATLTPLKPDFSALAEAVPFTGEGKAPGWFARNILFEEDARTLNIGIGERNPSVWYLLERKD